MSTNQEQPVAARSALARVLRIVTDYAGGYREGLGRAAVLDELADASTDPELLSQAAAMHAVADNWYAITAVDLLLDAGASQRLMERYLDEPEPAGERALAGPDPFPAH